MITADCQRITLLVLAHLGAGASFVACASQAPMVEAEVIPIGSVAPASTSTEGPYIMGNEPGPLGQQLAPLASGQAPAAPSSSVPPRPSRPQPVVSFGTPHRPPPPPIPRRSSGRAVPGRPLIVDGIAHVAPYEVVPQSADEELLRAARDEHASIGAFARTICELLAHGAPLGLVHETQAALADEIRHTEMTLALLGEAGRLGALDAATQPLARDVREFLRDVFRGGAIGETLAAADADDKRGRATDPALRAYYETIANDEARHAALAFKTLRWLLEAHPAVGPTFLEERARLSSSERVLTDPLFAAIGT